MNTSESGSTLVLSMIVIVILVMCVACALDYTLQVIRDTEQTNARSQAITAATGALDLAFVQFREACRLAENQDLSAATITSGAAWSPMTSYSSLTGTGALSASFMNISGLATPITVALNALDATNPNAIAHPLVSGPAIPTQALSVTMPTWSYLAKATATYKSLKGKQTVNVCRVFQKVTMSPWQYAIFYNNDLEINPGAPMNVTGAVHTNGSLYTGGNVVNNLNFNNAVTYSGSWNPNGAFDPDDTEHTGLTPVPPAGTTPTTESAQLPENSNTLGSASTTPGLQDGYHEIIEPPPPAPATDPLAGTAADPSERYYNQAGVKIMLTGASRANPTVTIYDAAGNRCTSSSAKGSTDLAIYTAFNAAITTTATLQDARQNATMNLTTLDINKIEPALTSGGALCGTGANVVYIDDETANPAGGVNCGVELINGYQMPTGGLTVVSDNPVYILGDYNTAGSSADVANVPSNASSSNPLLPYAPDYTPQSCAVMADAVTILSNSWTNSNSTNPLSSRNASNTTVNTAILSGIVTSGVGFTYSGGAENFPRFLENWSGICFTYYGSMVELFNSMQATGTWQSGIYYNPPNRQWFFNTNFYTTPPPGTFEVITYAKSRWFIE